MAKRKIPEDAKCPCCSSTNIDAQAMLCLDCQTSLPDGSFDKARRRASRNGRVVRSVTHTNLNEA